MDAAEMQTITPTHRNVVPFANPATKATSQATRCSSCKLRELCLPGGLTGPDAERAEEIVYTRKRVKRGETIYRAGDEFVSIYGVRSGFFKTSLILEDGREQATGFHMAGELIGMEGIGCGRHNSSAVALEDSEICVIPYSRLREMSRDVAALEARFHTIMSRAIVREHNVMVMLGSMRAEERLAAFLLDLSQRFTARGYSHAEFNLRMTREEIGSYLGLTLETVSRAFSRFHEDGLISVHQRHIRIRDVEGCVRRSARAGQSRAAGAQRAAA
jgi:CRP/FNR family transcriptional regulator